ncbi:MAG TPA: hypothetical protein VFI95_05550 [Terriglobales bacterium]|nr:hypothetical protein [Terriglobales bacterium]
MKRNQQTSLRTPNQILDSVLALDRTVMELSMHLYNVPRRDRVRMRAHNRRLHRAVRSIDLTAKRLKLAARPRSLNGVRS